MVAVAAMHEAAENGEFIAALLENTAREVGIAFYNPSSLSIHLHQVRA